MNVNLFHDKKFMTTFGVAFATLLLILSSLFSPIAQAAGGGGPVGEADAPETEEFNPVLTDEKPEVADIEANNIPNRIAATFNGETESEMGFNWYTTDLFEDSKVWVSKSGNFDDTLEFEAEATEVTSHYGERDEDGYYIFADVEEDEEGEPVTDENGDPIINGYYLSLIHI